MTKGLSPAVILSIWSLTHTRKVKQASSQMIKDVVPLKTIPYLDDWRISLLEGIYIQLTKGVTRSRENDLTLFAPHNLIRLFILISLLTLYLLAGPRSPSTCICSLF